MLLDTNYFRWGPQCQQDGQVLRSFLLPGGSRSHRQDQWHDTQYKKAHLGIALKANTFSGISHAKGMVLEKVGVEAKQPNSAIRKCVKGSANQEWQKNHCFCTQWWLPEFY